MHHWKLQKRLIHEPIDFYYFNYLLECCLTPSASDRLVLDDLLRPEEE
jgi:hypothetical protein